MSPQLILVVDDDPEVRRLLALVLETDGYEVAQAPSGRRALAYVRDHGCDLMLLDQHMPGLSGSEVLQDLRSNVETRTLPVILVTGESGLDDRVAGLDQGALDYITKPFELDELRARVRAQLRGVEAWREEIHTSYEQRAAMAEALGRVAGEREPEAIAKAVCEELAVLPNVGSATLVALNGTHATALGVSGDCPWGLEISELAAPALGRYLSMRAAIGPWIERIDADGQEGSLLASATTACAPLAGPDGVVGLLMLGLEPRTPANRVADSLAAVIDFASVVAGVFGPALAIRQQRQSERGDLFSVLAKTAFKPHFQPIVDLDSGTVVGFEALTRFDDGTPPDQRFLEAARLGVGVDLEAATIAAAVNSATRLPARRWVSVNVSPDMLLATERLRELLANCSHDVVLELSEHEPVEDYDTLRAALGDSGLDARLSIDDAGSGFASLRHVLKLEPAFMKLDRSWVERIEADPARQALVAGLQGFADNIGCRLIAEGIETEAERSTLASLGVHLGQGYLFGAPSRSGALDSKASASIRTLRSSRKPATAGGRRTSTSA